MGDNVYLIVNPLLYSHLVYVVFSLRSHGNR